MRAAFAHFSPIAPAAVAAAVGIALTVFLLPGAGLQGGPTPLVSALGQASGRIGADLPATAKARAPRPERIGKVSFRAQLVTTPTEVAPQRQQAVTRAHRAHRRSRGPIERRAPATQVPVRAPAAPAPPAATRQSFSTSGKAKGHGRGHGHSRAPSPAVRAPAPRAPGHGKALGHSSEHHHGPPPGQSKKLPPGSPPAPEPPKSNGGGNGPKGGKK